MKFQQIEFASAAYEQAWELRDQVLRKPLGLQLQLSEREAECEQHHFGVFADNGELLACVSAVHLPSTGAIKLRQMAVGPAQQSKGVGRFLLLQVEEFLRERGIEKIEMHARISAQEFYVKLGYVTAGEPFLEVSIPHIKMIKLNTGRTRYRPGSNHTRQ